MSHDIHIVTRLEIFTRVTRGRNLPGLEILPGLLGLKKKKYQGWEFLPELPGVGIFTRVTRGRNFYQGYQGRNFYQGYQG